MKPICVTQPQPQKKSLQSWREFYTKKGIETEVEKGIDSKDRTYYNLWRDLSMVEQIELRSGLTEITKAHTLCYKISEKSKKPIMKERRKC